MFKKIYEIWTKGQRYDEVVRQKNDRITELRDVGLEAKDERDAYHELYEEAEKELEEEVERYVELMDAVQRMLSDHEIEKLERYRVK